MEPAELFLANLPLIERLIRGVCRRHRVNANDIDDFAAIIKLRLIENDYRVLRQFSNRSSVGTFLYVVIERFYFDYRDHEWGRWRPSLEARRHGDAAILLDQLMNRDSTPFTDACERLRQSHPEITTDELERLRAIIPQRTGRPKPDRDSESVLRTIVAPSTAEERLLQSETNRTSANISAAFRSVLSELTALEQVVLRMRFGSGLKVATIAASLRIDQKKLYRTIDRLLHLLRTALTREGVSAQDVSRLLQQGGHDIEIPFLTASEIQTAEPSNIPAERHVLGRRQTE